MASTFRNKILIINAHPNNESFCSEISKRYFHGAIQSKAVKFFAFLKGLFSFIDSIFYARAKSRCIVDSDLHEGTKIVNAYMANWLTLAHLKL